MSLRVNETFISIQGESTFAGFPCVFVRLTGCPLRCAWCDTQYAYDDGEEMRVGEIVEKVLAYGAWLVEITGGEPLAQPEAPDLISRLCDLGQVVLVETSGARPVDAVDERAHIIMDVKCPSSRQAEKMHWENIEHLTDKDEVKFVCADRRDYDYAKEIIAKYEVFGRCPVLLSPASGALDARQLADWIVADRLPAKLQLQLHKFIWPDRDRGV